MVGLAFFTALFCITSTITCRKTTDSTRIPKDAVHLSKVASLTLRNGRMTTSRRVDPVPQLTCIGPKDVCKLYSVDVMRCTNDGADYDDGDIQWSCKASLPEEFKLGSTDVICEGYQSSEDPYILKGSCGVEYRLMLTDKGDAKYGNKNKWPTMDFSFGKSKTHQVDSDGNLAGYIFAGIFLFVLFIILRGIWTNWRRNPPRLGGGHRPNGGGGDDDAPPPYDDAPPRYSSPRKPGSKSTTTPSSSRSHGGSSRAGQQEPWRPGFWTGAAAGAAGAYAAGLAGNRTRQPEQPTMQQRAQSSWFGNARSDTRSDPPSSSFSSMRAPSSERHESTGFGSTRRR